MIDLDTCVGCQACATSCKEWNAGGYSAPLTDQDAHGSDPHGAWLNRVHSYEVGDGAQSRTVHFPRSCLHCETPACVTVCPTGASYKRASDGIVLVNPDTCIGCKLCSWACPYGAREYDYDDGMMKKCTLCVDRIYNETFAPEDRIPACVRACPTGARHFGDLGDPDERRVAARQGARGLRPAAGDGLQAGQQISAAAAAPRPDRAAGSARRRAAGDKLRLARRPVLRLGRQDPGALNRNAMHPAYSVIVFTTASGAGYGLLIWLAVAAAAQSRAARSGARVFRARPRARADHHRAARPRPLHLGRPERAWRALSQWRSSWLSREGVAAIVTYLPAGALGLGLGVRRIRAGPARVGAHAVGAVRARHAVVHRHDLRVAAHHPRLAPAAGRADLPGAGARDRRRAADPAARGVRLRRALGGHRQRVLALVLGAILKRRYWTAIDTAAKTYTAEAATGLGRSRHGAAARSAAHPAELRDARDGLSGGAAARREASRLVGDAAVSAAARGRASAAARICRLRLQIAVAMLAALSAAAAC